MSLVLFIYIFIYFYWRLFNRWSVIHMYVYFKAISYNALYSDAWCNESGGLLSVFNYSQYYYFMTCGSDTHLPRWLGAGWTRRSWHHCILRFLFSKDAVHAYTILAHIWGDGTVTRTYKISHIKSNHKKVVCLLDISSVRSQSETSPSVLRHLISRYPWLPW